jgi:hypothetical protein
MEKRLQKERQDTNREAQRASQLEKKLWLQQLGFEAIHTDYLKAQEAISTYQSRLDLAGHRLCVTFQERNSLSCKFATSDLLPFPRNWRFETAQLQEVKNQSAVKALHLSRAQEDLRMRKKQLYRVMYHFFV